MNFPEEIVVCRFNDNPKDSLTVRVSLDTAAHQEPGRRRQVAIYKLDHIATIRRHTQVIAITTPAKKTKH